MVPLNLDQVKLRAWWSYRQGLDGRLAGKAPAAVLEETGWMRSVGGSGPYLGLFARCGARREAIDKLAEKCEIHELPSARSCTYVLPKRDFALGLKVGQKFGGATEIATAKKLGVTDAEIAKLRKAVLAALKKGPLAPEEIREATGDASRNLGEAGKKKGLTTTLPLALQLQQSAGEIRRISTNGRFDNQRYKYTLWDPSPLDGLALSDDEAQTAMAKLYCQWIGPASIAEFQWHSALSGKAAKAALDPLKLVPLENGSDLLILPSQLDELKSFKAPKEPHYTLVSCIDGIVLLRRDLAGILDEVDSKHRVVSSAGKALRDLTDHAIMDRGRLVGVWQYDVENQEIVSKLFIKSNADVNKAIAEMQEYITGDLGDARSFSLDSPKSRAPRIAALLAAG
jgi:hypothetical protein